MKKSKDIIEQPVEYLAGFSKFLNCKIDLSLKPMIPRPETEYWTKKAIEDINLSRAKSREKINILDIFAGSGCIGIAILKNIKNIRADFAEINKNFLKQIKINLKLNKVNSKKHRIIQSDIFKNIKCRYNYIFANPPYVATTRENLVQKSVLNFEPHAAIFAGNDGLFYIRKFLKKAKNYLKKHGKIYLEFDYFQKKELEKILSQLGYKNFKFLKDQYKKWRYVILVNNR